MKKFLILFIIPFLLFAEVTESYSKKSVQVGEESILDVKFQTGDVVEWSLPSKGFIFSGEDSDTPVGELIEITQTPTEIKLKYVYFKSGTFKAKLSWKNAMNETTESQEDLEVKSVLTGEKELLDIADPISFSGSYIVRLLTIVLLGLVIILGIAYILFYFNNRRKIPVKDALFEKMEEEQDINYFKNKLHALLLEAEFPHKEFIFYLSGYIKEKIGFKLQSSIMHFTQSEIHDILQSDYNVPNVELLTIDSYFNSIKYMPNEEVITRDNALSLIKYWDRILR